MKYLYRFTVENLNTHFRPDRVFLETVLNPDDCEYEAEATEDEWEGFIHDLAKINFKPQLIDKEPLE